MLAVSNVNMRKMAVPTMRSSPRTTRQIDRKKYVCVRSTLKPPLHIYKVLVLELQVQHFPHVHAGYCQHFGHCQLELKCL